MDGWYADPDTAIYEGLYWVYPTSSYPYEQQTYLDAFSSPDLITWTKHKNILIVENVKWAKKAVWAPAPAFRNGKYYLYFAANDIQEDEASAGAIGGIGVAVSDKPEGPYIDALGKPLIGEYHNGAQPIDQDVFIDEDGQAYIYYGGHSHANVALLNSDMISIGTFPDGTQFREITPENYVEGSQMLKRNGTYYFMWSEGGWTGPNYSVSYAMSSSPTGPFPRKAQILKQDSAVARGSGHNAIISVPGTEIYYILYHRRPLSETDGNRRVICYDRLYFAEDGSIKPVEMLVKDNFSDGDMVAWKSYGGGNWTVKSRHLTLESEENAMALLDTNFTDLVFDATVSVPEGDDAGLIFRATGLSTESSDFSGYYAGLSSGMVKLDKSTDGERETLVAASWDIAVDTEYKVRVIAKGSDFSFFVDNLDAPVVSGSDSSFNFGKDGVRASGAGARFGSVSIEKP